VKLVEAVGFETPDHQIGHFGNIVVKAQLYYSKDCGPFSAAVTIIESKNGFV
jgi:hypothetical protein